MKVDIIRVTEVIALDASANVRITQDGYLVANPRVARTGIQLYSGQELGKPDMAIVRVYRPEAEVMHKDALRSITHRPVTNNHPGELVTADNWKKYSAGQMGDEVARDGEFVRVPIMLMDGGAIKDYQAGKKELSLGYQSRIEWRSGKTDDGQDYDAVQTNIRVNHLALVDAARGGPKLAIGDEATALNKQVADQATALINAGKYNRKGDIPSAAKDGNSVLTLAGPTPGLCYAFAQDGSVYRSALVSIKAQAEKSQDAGLITLTGDLIKQIDTKEKAKMSDTEKKLVSVTVDSMNVEMTDIAAQVVNRRIAALEKQLSDAGAKATADMATSKTALDAANAQVAKLTTEGSTKDAEIVTLKKQVEDAKLTPAKLDALVVDRGGVIGKARVILGDKLVIDGKTDDEIRRQVVDFKLADAAKGWEPAMVKASFDTLTADIKPEQVRASDQMRQSFNGNPGPARQGQQGAGDSYDAYDKKLGDAWKGTPAQQ